MKYDGFQRVAQRFEVLWPESIRYAPSALQERLSTSCFYSNNHPYCPPRWSSAFGLAVELKENHQKKKNHRKCTVVRCVCTACFFFSFFFPKNWDELVWAEFIRFAVAFLSRFGELCQQQWAVLRACYCHGHKTLPPFSSPCKNKWPNLFTALCTEERKEKFTRSVLTYSIFSSLQHPRVWLRWI